MSRPRLVRFDLRPVLAAGTVDRGFNDAVVLGAAGVGQDDELSIVVIDRIVVLRLARRDQAGRGRGIGGVDQADLGSLVVMDAKQEQAPVLGHVEPQEIARIVLLLDDCVSVFRAHYVPQHAAGAVLVVEPDVKQGAAVRGPLQRAVGVDDPRIDEFAGGGLDYVHRVEFRALGIDGIGDQAMVRAVGDAGQAEIGMRLGERVAVEQHMFLAAIARLPAKERMLTADDEASVISEGPIGRGNADIVLLDAALHLGEELRLKRLGVGHDRVGVGILGFEIASDVGSEQRGVPHHRLPVRGAEPGVIVRPRNAVMQRGRGPAGGARSPRAVERLSHGLGA